MSRFVFMLVVGLIIFVGLPLLSWGITDIQGFMDHPARLGYVGLMILLQGFVAIQFPGVGRSGGEGRRLVQRQKIAVILLQVLSLAIMIAAPYTDRHETAVIADFELTRYIGLFLFSAGFLLMNWSEATLGRHFSIQVTIQEDHQLITRGPYRVLRHPRYLGIIVFNIGIALVFRSWLALILALLLALVLLWRIQDEEALMRQEFGAAWETYSHNSWRVIPFVY